MYSQIILRRFRLHRIDPQRILTPTDWFIFLKEIDISILSEGREIHHLTAIELKDQFTQNGISHAIESVKAMMEVCKLQGEALAEVLHANFDRNITTFYFAQMLRENRWLFFYLMKSLLRIAKEYLHNHKLNYLLLHQNLHNVHDIVGQMIDELENALILYENELTGQEKGA
jgi:hypothetical protein